MSSQLSDPTIRAAWQEDINRYCRVHLTFRSPRARNKYSSQHITHPCITHMTLPGHSCQYGTKSHKILGLPNTDTTETWVCFGFLKSAHANQLAQVAEWFLPNSNPACIMSKGPWDGYQPTKSAPKQLLFAYSLFRLAAIWMWQTEFTLLT